MKEQEVQIKFPVFGEEEELDIISKSLDCRIFVPKDTLQKFIFQLRKIDDSLQKKSNENFLNIIEKKKKLVESLSNKCENLKQRNLVISFAEEAEGIANSSPLLTDEEVKNLADNLNARIDSYVANARPSKNNMKFLRFAKKLLQKAIKHEPVLIKAQKEENIIKLRQSSPSEISLEDFALAESLYELAASLYENQANVFTEILEKNFSQNTKKEMIFHIKNCQGSLSLLKSKKDKQKVMQGIIGYAHTVTDYFASDTPYPSIDELDNLFSAEMY